MSILSRVFGAARALRSRNYRLFFAGQGTSLVGTWMTRVATSWLVYRLAGSAIQIATNLNKSSISRSDSVYTSAVCETQNGNAGQELADPGAGLAAAAAVVLDSPRMGDIRSLALPMRINQFGTKRYF